MLDNNFFCFIISSIVLDLRLIGKGFSAGKKLCDFLGVSFLSKLAFRNRERNPLKVGKRCSQENKNSVLDDIKGTSDCQVLSVDGACQHRDYLSFNSCVSAISIDTGQILEVEIITQYFHIRSKSNSQSVEHICAND
ncbi:uncharacterized protein NPIL_68631 [Nephila pilipes]|uniref:Uncharacterized protein n=1 Tax=Nephila pilipes TaxID=299642 RepID=A0A8X6MY73_NEPPI|nr:uncharacterized protein NPIL_68631 [Nephila pilipes]